MNEEQIGKAEALLEGVRALFAEITVGDYMVAGAEFLERADANLEAAIEEARERLGKEGKHAASWAEARSWAEAQLERD